MLATRRMMPRLSKLPRPCRTSWGAWWLASDDVISGYILRGDGFEPAELTFVSRYLRRGMTVLDVGAHHGLDTLLAARCVGPTGRVIAFEPSPRERRRLRWHVWLNRCTNVRIESTAVAAAEGTAELYICLGRETGCNSLRPPSVDEPTRRITIRLTTLDRYVTQNRIRRIDMLKLDIEGAELDALRDAGWRGGVFFVDDNFIGNKRRLKTELLPALIDWQRRRGRISFLTEASINLADDPELMDLMVQAGFETVFIGIETPEETSLVECSKIQNTNRDLLEDVRRIQRAGLEVQGGFIVGFDHDTPSIFERQIAFIQQSGIVTAMVGILEALPGTRLFERLRREGRVRGRTTGDNVDGTTNIIPRMGLETLREGYKRILRHIYSPKHYYDRILTFLREYRPPKVKRSPRFRDIMAFIRSIVRLGILGRERFHYWRLLLWTLLHRRAALDVAVAMAICGYHFRKVSKRVSDGSAARGE